jgi:tripartite-type tricarboxylate transporter receptor subunit TctC
LTRFSPSQERLHRREFPTTTRMRRKRTKRHPQNIIEKLNREINTALSDPKVRGRIIGLGNVLMPLSPADFGKLLIDDTEKWAKVIRAANIKPE